MRDPQTAADGPIDTPRRRLVGRILGVVDERACSRGGALTVLVLALGQHALVSLAWPLRTGRDFTSYARAYDQLFDWSALLPWIAMQRMPLGPLVVGGALDLGGGWGAEIVAALLFAGSVLAWCVAASAGGPRVATAVALALLVFPGYAELFHEWSTDLVFASAFALWGMLVARAVASPSVMRFGVAGAATALLTLVRPSSLVLVAVVAVAALVEADGLRARSVALVAVAGCALVPLGTWAALNGARHDDVAISRGGGSSVPLFRAFVDDRIVSPENGPASRELADLVEAELLPEEPYRSYTIDLETFFSSGSPRMHEDLVSLSDRELGWASDYALLGAVGREAVRAHPGTYAANVAGDLLRAATVVLFGSADYRGEDGAEAQAVSGSEPDAGLPVPSEGQPIPAAHQGAYLGTPEGRIEEVWTSPADHGPVFRRAGDRERFGEMEAWVTDAASMLPTHGNAALLARTADRASRVFPPALAWILLALVAGVVRRPTGARATLYPALGAAVALIVTVAAVAPVAQYVVPMAPAFVVLGLVTLLAPRSRGVTPE